MTRFRPMAIHGVVLILLTMGAWQFGSGIWIHAKAQFAHYLIDKAWQQTLVRHAPVKPWPWADTWPVARLRWRNVDLYVLAGVNGAALPFGPGMDPHVRDKTRLIAGHRDTHFAFLARVRRGDRLILTDMEGRQTLFQVQAQQVIDSSSTPLPVSGEVPVLLLITCYPFDALRAGGPLRMVVRAVPAAVAEQADREKTPHRAALPMATGRGYSA